MNTNEPERNDAKPTPGGVCGSVQMKGSRGEWRGGGRARRPPTNPRSHLLLLPRTDGTKVWRVVVGRFCAPAPLLTLSPFHLLIFQRSEPFWGLASNKNRRHTKFGNTATTSQKLWAGWGKYSRNNNTYMRMYNISSFTVKTTHDLRH